MAGKEEQDGVERVTANRPYFFLGDFGESKCRAALEVDIVGKGECGQCGEWRATKEICRRPVFRKDKGGEEDSGNLEKGDKGTHSRGTEGGQPLPLAHFLVAEAHTIGNCETGLKRRAKSAKRSVMRRNV